MMKLLRIVAALAILLAQTVPSFAAFTTTPVFAQTPKQIKFQLVNGSGTTAQTLYTCPTNGAKIFSLFATSTDTSDRIIEIIDTKSATDYILASATVTLAAGTDGGNTGVTNVLDSFSGLPNDSDGNAFFFCETGDVIKVRAQVAVTAAKVINVVGVAAEF